MPQPGIEPVTYWLLVWHLTDWATLSQYPNDSLDRDDSVSLHESTGNLALQLPTDVRPYFNIPLWEYSVVFIDIQVGPRADLGAPIILAKLIPKFMWSYLFPQDMFNPYAAAGI